MAKINWFLLADTRRHCWRAWWYGASPLLLLLLLQTFSTRFESMELLAWLWAGINIFPGLALLFISVVRSKLPQKLIPNSIHRAVLAGTWGYLLLLYLTVLAEVQVLNTGGALKTYLQLSYAWLLPAQFIVLTGYYLVLFSRARLARPDNRNILELAAEKSSDTRRSMEGRNCFGHIASGDLAGAFQLADSTSNHLSEQARTELAVLRGNFSQINREMEDESINAAEAQKHLNRLTIGLMNIIEKI